MCAEILWILPGMLGSVPFCELRLDDSAEQVWSSLLFFGNGRPTFRYFHSWSLMRNVCAHCIEHYAARAALMRRLVWAHVILCEQSGSFSVSYERRGVDTAGGTFYCIYSAGKDRGFLFLFWQREAKLLVFSLFVC